ncbi:hypothetical protein [Desmospora profundinema]|uniref:Uncharacterized protein n=1 Tax=Desmospora profundinema TaxID=1571184 RepID=A0ABU1IS70_9BACL|nr:hypothetical protein [Desmospora profundinema]MDR6227623.1 hypothetical protein [Desmospora profundinema]
MDLFGVVKELVFVIITVGIVIAIVIFLKALERWQYSWMKLDRLEPEKSLCITVRSGKERQTVQANSIEPWEAEWVTKGKKEMIIDDVELQDDRDIYLKESPTWEEVQSALYRLNRDEVDDIILHIRKKGNLFVGEDLIRGERRYLVIYQSEDDGQAREMLCVRLDMVIKAFKHFYEKGVLTDELSWNRIKPLTLDT